jgi:hypothetical protein
MPLPRPASIFDEAPPRPSVSTGVSLSYPKSFRNVLGLVVPGQRGGSHQVIMRGTAGDPENDDIVDAAADLSRKMMQWLEDNTMIVVEGGTIYGHGDAPLASIGAGLPEFGSVDINGNVVTGRIEERRNRAAVQQGTPLFVYIKHIYLQRPGERPEECKPVVVGRGWV